MSLDSKASKPPGHGEPISKNQMLEVGAKAISLTGGDVSVQR